MVRLNFREEEVMQILWRLKKAFVKEIIAEMPDPKPKYNTISSIVRKLEVMGVVGHTAFGKAHQYFPILEKEDYGKTSFQRLIKNYFHDSYEEVLSFFVREDKMDVGELDHLLRQLKEKDDES